MGGYPALNGVIGRCRKDGASFDCTRRKISMSRGTVRPERSSQRRIVSGEASGVVTMRIYGVVVI